MKQAREDAGLTYAQLAAKLPKGARLGAPRLCRIEQSGGAPRTKAANVETLAQALDVEPAWLRGEPGAFPVTGFRLEALPSGDLPELPVSDLRRARFVQRCFKAVRRDERRAGRAIEGTEQHRTERWLFLAFWFLPELAENAAGLMPLPPVRLTAPLPEGSNQERPAEWTETAFAYWSAVLRPWWEGNVALDYRALAGVPWERRPSEPSTPRDLLDAVRGRWHLGQLLGVRASVEMPASKEDEEIARREAEQKAVALEEIKEAHRHPKAPTEDQRRAFVESRDRAPAPESGSAASTTPRRTRPRRGPAPTKRRTP